MDLFDDLPPHPDATLTHIAAGAVLMCDFARDAAFTMSVAMSNCGALGWVSSASGYRYATTDPQSDQPWPAMPACLLGLAQLDVSDSTALAQVRAGDAGCRQSWVGR